ncbi:MAG: hypothetical protein NT076_01660 [Candidatus Pacearchaeota archaeon]|nr:hypothetical protein [Candidatus Pacearchaeota archaeon]
MSRKNLKLGNRGYGLVAIALGGIFGSAGGLPFSIVGGLLVTEGVGDLISGEHHYLSVSAYEYISRRIKR